MTWRQSAREFHANKGDKNKAMFRAIVKKGKEPGMLAYDGDEPVGWCAVAPRDEFPRLENSRVWARVDDQPVWSVTCLFVKKGYRNHGLSSKLIDAATKLAMKHGANIVEAYPQDLKGKRLPDAFVWTGLASSFAKTGFEVAVSRSENKPVMRKKV